MSQSVLVGNTTRYGSTQEVAKRITATLPTSPLYQMPASDIRNWKAIET